MNCFQQLGTNKHIIENYKEAVEMFNGETKGMLEKEYSIKDMEFALSHGALIMFQVFLEEFEKGNLIVEENQK